MPGLTIMEGATNTQRSSDNQVQNNQGTPPPLVKDEFDDRDLFQDEDDLDDGRYKPRPQLSQPNVHMRSLASLIKDLENGNIDVDPEYQREVVWTAERMTGLIDSLMENYYIPPIIFNAKKVTSLETGGKPREVMVCVDGKQRLSSVRAFVKGMIPCHDHQGEKWWFCETPGTRRKKVLPEETRKSFLDKDFVTFQFTELSPAQEEDLFARVQMGVQLSAAEKMRATTGPWQELAKLFVDDFPVIYSLMKDRVRAKDFQLTLACFSQIVEVTHPSASNGVPILKTNHSALPKLLSNKGAVDDALKSHLASVWNTFKELVEQDPDVFTNADKHLRGVQTFAPVEMVAVTVMISMYSRTRNHRLLLGDITALREALREHFVDLRLNASVWKFVWDYIDDLEAIRSAFNGTTVDRNLSAQQHAPSSATATVGSPAPALLTPASQTIQPKAPATKTKSSTKSLSKKPAVVKKEPGTPSAVRPAKRKRADPGPTLSHQSSVSLPNGNVISPHFADGNIASREHVFSTQPTGSPNATLQSASQEQLLVGSTSYSAVPSSTTTALPRTSTPVYSPAQSSMLRAKGYNIGLSIGKQMSIHTSNISGSASQQTSVPKQNGYLAPTATMGLSPSTILLAPNLSMGSPYTATIPSRQSRPSGNRSAGSRKGVSAFAPVHTDADPTFPPMPQNHPSDIIPAPSQLSDTPFTTLPEPSPPKQKKRKSITTRPTPAQVDGVIDLTSDTELEEERQTLLSAFKGNSVKQAQVPNVSSVSTAPMRRHPVIVHDLQEEDVADENNPYARYRKI